MPEILLCKLNCTSTAPRSYRRRFSDTTNAICKGKCAPLRASKLLYCVCIYIHIHIHIHIYMHMYMFMVHAFACILISPFLTPNTPTKGDPNFVWKSPTWTCPSAGHQQLLSQCLFVEHLLQRVFLGAGGDFELSLAG